MTLPTVTQILGKYADFSHVPEAVLESACIRGSAVHLACTNMAQGVWSPVPTEYRGYVTSFSRWFHQYVDRVYLIEERLTDEANQFTGQPDLVCTLKGSSALVLVDLKTSAAPQPLWAVQLSTYLALCEKRGLDVTRCFSLRLKGDGTTPSIREYTDSWRECYSIFLSALNVWRWMNS